MAYIMKHGNSGVKFKELGSTPAKFDFKSEDQGLNEAKKKARVDVADQIFMEDASEKGLMEKGKKLGEAFSEIQQYTDY